MTVGTKILGNVFSFHHCNKTTIATAMSSGISNGELINEYPLNNRRLES